MPDWISAATSVFTALFGVWVLYLSIQQRKQSEINRQIENLKNVGKERESSLKEENEAIRKLARDAHNRIEDLRLQITEMTAGEEMARKLHANDHEAIRGDIAKIEQRITTLTEKFDGQSRVLARIEGKLEAKDD